MDDKSMEKYHEEETQKCKSSIDWKQLREEFYDECTNKYSKLNLNACNPIKEMGDMFEWFKNKIEK